MGPRKGAAVAAVGIALRCLAARGELWLDEVWSLQSVREMRGLREVFTWRIDNNHLLNSIYLWLAAPDSAWAARALALVSSAALLLFLAALARRGSREALISLFLISLSYPLTLYGGEARGYTPAIAALGAAYFLLLKIEKTGGSIRTNAAFQILCAAALLAHYSSLQLVAAFFLWTVLKHGVAAAAGLYWISAAVAVVEWLLFMRHMPPGSGELDSATLAPIDALSITIGGPPFGTAGLAGVVSIVAALAAAWLILTALAELRAASDDRWLLFALAIVVMPSAAVFFVEPRVLYARYFLPSILAAYFLFSSWAARSWERGSRALPALALALFAGLNAAQLADLFQHGRNSYRTVLSKLAPGEVLEFDQRFRQGAMLRFYAAPDSVPRVQRDADETALPVWARLPASQSSPPSGFLAHDSRSRSFTAEIETANGRYCSPEIFPGGRLSGWSLALYRPCGTSAATRGLSREPLPRE